MKGLKKLIVLFVYIGIVTSSFAATDFLDRFDLKEKQHELDNLNLVLSDILGTNIASGTAVISHIIGREAIKSVFPFEFNLRRSHIVDIGQHKMNIRKLEQKLTNLMANPESYKPVTKVYTLNGIQYKSTLKDIEMAKHGIKANIGTEKIYHKMKARQLKKINKFFKIVHKSMMTSSEVVLVSGYKVPKADIRRYRKVFRASKLVTFLGVGASVYFLSKLLVDCGILVLTDENLVGKLPAIESSEYVIEKLRSGMFKLGDEKEMDLEGFEAELLDGAGVQ